MFRQSVSAAACALLLASCTSGDLPAFDLAPPEVALKPPEVHPGTITGHLVADQQEDSVEGREVSLRDAAGSSRAQRTDAAGAFAFSDLQPGRYTLEVRVAPFDPVFVPNQAVGSGETLDVGALPLHRSNLNQQGLATLVGKVVLDGGDPTQARVEVLAQPAGDRVAIALVGADARFVQPLPPGVYKLRATHPLYLPAELDGVEVKGSAPIDLTSQPLSLALNPATVKGTVLAEAERWDAVQDASGKTALTLVHELKPAKGVLVTAAAGGKSTTTDVNGRFELAGLVGKPNKVRLTLAGSHDPAGEHAVDLEPGGTLTLPDVSLALDRGSFSGSVRLADGAPLTGATVSVTGTGYSAAVVPDAADPSTGSYVLKGLPVGPSYELAAAQSRYGRQVKGGLTLAGDGAVTTVLPFVLTAQQGDFVIDDGDNANTPGFTRTRTVNLKFTNVASAACFWVDEDVTKIGLAGGCVANRSTITLVDRDGRHDVYAMYEDANGVKGPLLSASVVLDRLKPASPSVVLNGGAAFTRSNQTLTLTLSAREVAPASGEEASGLASFLASASATLDQSGRLSGSPQPFAVTASFTRPSVLDGVQPVFVQFIDNAGNVSDVAQATITVDTQPPRGSIAALDGPDAEAAGYTRVSLVDLERTIYEEPNDGAVYLRVANSQAELATAVLQAVPSQQKLGCAADPCVTAAAWPIDARQAGLKTLWAQLEDAAGNRSGTLSTTITFDNKPPAPVSASLPSAYTASRKVQLAVSAQDNVGLAPTPVSVDEVTGGTSTGKLAMPANGQIAVDLSAGDGLKQLVTKFHDLAGNESAVTTWVTLDQTLPEAQLVLGDGSGYATSSAVAVTLRSASPDLAQVAVKSDLATAAPVDCAAATYVTFAPPLSVTFATEETRRITVCLKDRAGNVGAPLVGTVTWDKTPPTGTLTLNGTNPTATNARLVTLDLTASDTSPVSVAVGDDANPVANAAFEPFRSSRTWTLSPGAGAKTVTVRLRDAAGNTTDLSRGITYDPQPPSGTVTINGGAKYVAAGGASSLSLAFTESEPATLAWVVNGGAPVDCTRLPSSSYAAFAATASYPLATPPPAADGVYLVTACLLDPAGNYGSATAAITVDQTRPELAVRINDGAAYTTTGAVTLTLSGDADLADLAIANGALTCAGATYALKYASAVAWNLDTAAGGTKTVQVCGRDRAGNTTSTPRAATIVYDPDVPTGSLAIVGVLPATATASPSAKTTSERVALHWTAADATNGAPSEMLLSNDAAFTGAVWQPYAADIAWRLPTGDGSKVVYGKLRDPAKQTTASIASPAIVLDTTPPGPSALGVLNGATITNQRAITLTVSSTDTGGFGATPLTVSEDPLFANVSPVALPSNGQQAFTLSAGDGPKVVYARVRDAAGLETLLSTRISLDQTGAGADLLLGDGSGFTTGASLAVTLRNAPADLAQVALAVDPSGTATPVDCAAATYGTWAPPLAVNLGSEGGKRVSVCLKDGAGNVTGPLAGTVIYDKTGPTGTVTLTTGTPTNDRTVSLALSATDALSPVTSFAIGDDATPLTASTPFEPLTTTRLWTVSAGDGTKTITVRFRDAAGNTSDVSRAVVLDQTPPGGTVALNGGAAYVKVGDPSQLSIALTSSETVTVAVKVDRRGDFADCASLPASDFVAFATPQTYALASPPGADGPYGVTACFKDAAGNRGRATAYVTVDQTAPRGTFTVNSQPVGAAYTWTNAVTLYLNTGGNLDVTQVAVANGALASCATASYVSYAPSLAWNLTASTGAQTVYVCFKDAAGNTSPSPVSQSVTYDPDTPSGTLSIAGTLGPKATVSAAAYTNSVNARLTLTASDATNGAPSEMLVSNDPAFPSANAWQPFSATLDWTLPGGDGPKTVYVKLRDPAGHVSSTLTSNTLALDATPPGAPVLVLHDNDLFPDNGYTNLVRPGGGAPLTVDLDSTGATGYELANEPGFAATGTGYATASGVTFPKTGVAFTLATSRGDATYAMYARCFDDVGNSSAFVSASVVYDATGPTSPALSLRSPTGSASVTASTSVTGLVSGSGADLMQLSGDLTAGWQKFAPSLAGTLSDCPAPVAATGCTRTVKLTLADLAGNTLATNPDATITLDSVAPATPTVALAAQKPVGSYPAGAVTADPNVTLTLGGLAAGDQVIVGNDPTFAGQVWRSYSGPLTWTLTPGDGAKTVYVQSRDGVGNVQAVVGSATITYGAPPPAPAGLNATSGNRSAQLDWGAVGAADKFQVLRYDVAASTNCTGIGALTPTIAGSPTSNTFADANLTNFNNYCYAVRSVNTVGAYDVPAVNDTIALLVRPVLPPPDWATIAVGGSTYGPYVIGGAAAITVRWVAVPNAQAYKLYWDADTAGAPYTGSRLANFYGSVRDASPLAFDGGLASPQKVACSEPGGVCFEYKLTGLEQDTGYHFAVTACAGWDAATKTCTGGESAYATDQSETTYGLRLIKRVLAGPDNRLWPPYGSIEAYTKFGHALAAYPSSGLCANLGAGWLIGDPSWMQTSGATYSFVGKVYRGCSGLADTDNGVGNISGYSPGVFAFGASVGMLKRPSPAMVIGGPIYDYNASTLRSGRVFVRVVSGGTTYVIDNTRAYDLFGHSLAVEDVTLDGVDDFVVGGPGAASAYPAAEQTTGVVKVFNGNVAGNGPAPIFTAYGPAAGSEFGYAVDMKSNKLVVGLPGQSKIYVYSYTSSATPTFTYLRTITGPTNPFFGGVLATRFGHAISILNGQFAVVTAPASTIYGGGAAYLVDLNAGTLVYSLRPPGGDYTGLKAAVLPVGNGTDWVGSFDDPNLQRPCTGCQSDTPDMVIGVPQSSVDPNLTQEGAFYVFPLPTASSAVWPLYSITGHGSYARMGHTVISALDHDNDGRQDLMVSEPELLVGRDDTNGTLSYGAVYLYRTDELGLAPFQSQVGTGSFYYRAQGGTPPYRYAITSGPGTIDPVTGYLSGGSATAPATTVKVTDAKGRVFTARPLQP